MSHRWQQSTHSGCEYRKPPASEALRLLKRPELLTKVESVNYFFKMKTSLRWLPPLFEFAWQLCVLSHPYMYVCMYGQRPSLRHTRIFKRLHSLWIASKIHCCYPKNWKVPLTFLSTSLPITNLQLFVNWRRTQSEYKGKKQRVSLASEIEWCALPQTAVKQLLGEGEMRYFQSKLDLKLLCSLSSLYSPSFPCFAIRWQVESIMNALCRALSANQRSTGTHGTVHWRVREAIAAEWHGKKLSKP